MLKEQTLTYTLKILPAKSTDPDAEMKLVMTMDSYADACNLASDFARDFGEEKPIAMHHVLYGPIRSSFGLRSQMACDVFRTVAANIQTIRTIEKRTGKKGDYPQYRKGFCVYTSGRDYSIKNGTVSLDTICGRVEIPFVCGKDAREAIFSRGNRIGGARLRYKNGEYYLDVSVTFEINPPNVDSKPNIVGVDSGINKILAASGKDRDIIIGGGKIKNIRARYKALRQELQKKGTPAARRKIRKIGNRENSYTRDVLHCVSKALVQDYPENTLFCFEDLYGIRSVTEKVRLRDRYLFVSWPFDRLIQMVTYKARKNSQDVMLVTPDYTSQRCPVCGHIARGNRNRRTHSFKCRHCGYSSNDDRIGGMNLRIKGEFTANVYRELGLDDFEGVPANMPEIRVRNAIKTAMAGFPVMGGDVSHPERRALKFFSIRRQRGYGRVELSLESEGRRKNSVCTSGQSQASSSCALQGIRAK